MEGKKGASVEDVIVEYELAEDLQTFISQSDDVDFDDTNLKDTIFKYDKDDLLEVTKTILSPTKIIGVIKIDDTFLENCTKK